MPVQQKVLSIIEGRLKPTGPSKVTKELSGEVQKEIARFKQEIANWQQLADEKPDIPIFKSLLEKTQKAFEDFQKSVKEIITTVTEYVDLKGAKYVETVTKDGSNFGTGTPVRKLVKTEERFLPDGRKIVTTTTHDKSDMYLMGEGHQDGYIEKVEELIIPDKGVVARRTTGQQASGYGGRSVTKEASIDGEAMGLDNTVMSTRFMNEDGITTYKSKRSGRPQAFDDSFEYKVNEHGIAKPKADMPKIDF